MPGVAFRRAGPAQQCNAALKCSENLTCTDGFCQPGGLANGEEGSSCSPTAAQWPPAFGDSSVGCAPPYLCKTEGGTSSCHVPGLGDKCSGQCEVGLSCSSGACKRPACYCRQANTACDNGKCRSVTSVSLGSPTAGCESGSPPLHFLGLARISYNSAVSNLGSLLTAMSLDGVTLPPFEAVIDAFDPLGPPMPAFVAADGLYHFGLTGLERLLPAMLQLDGKSISFESCSAGYALYRDVADSLLLHVVALSPQSIENTEELTGFDLGLAADWKQSTPAPVSVTSLNGGRVIIVSRGSSKIYYSSVDTSASLSFTEQDFAGDKTLALPAFERPQLLDANTFSVLAKYEAAAGVYLEVYQLQTGKWTRIFQVALNSINEEGDFDTIASYWIEPARAPPRRERSTSATLPS